MIARGYQGRPIYAESESKHRLLALLADVVERHGWLVFDWVIMTNHIHLVVELQEPNLSVGMKRLIGLHAQWWNWHEAERGHVYMGRFRSIEVGRGAYLASVSRYIDLNPVRAGMCDEPSRYPWSGYAANAGLRLAEPFHRPDLGRTAIAIAADTETACREYRRFVALKARAWAGRGHQFEERPSLDDVLSARTADALREAKDVWWYSTSTIAEHLGVSDRTVREWVRTGRIPVRPNGTSGVRAGELPDGV